MVLLIELSSPTTASSEVVSARRMHPPIALSLVIIIDLTSRKVTSSVQCTVPLILVIISAVIVIVLELFAFQTHHLSFVSAHRFRG